MAVSVTTLIEGVSMSTKMLQVEKATNLQKLLAKSGMIKSLISVMSEWVSLLPKNCEAACQRMS